MSITDELIFRNAAGIQSIMMVLVGDEACSVIIKCASGNLIVTIRSRQAIVVYGEMIEEI